MYTQNERDILNAVSYPMTATAIAQASGHSKAAQIADTLNKLVKNGDLIADDSGRYVLYKKNDRRSSSNTVIQNCNAPATTTNNQTASKHKLPDGYKAGKIRSDANGDVYRNILTPDGQKVKLLKGYTLLNINNGDKIAQVANPSVDGWVFINRYVEEKGYSNYKVELAGVGQIGKLEDLNGSCGILDVRITRVNKAAK